MPHVAAVCRHSHYGPLRPGISKPLPWFPAGEDEILSNSCTSNKDRGWRYRCSAVDSPLMMAYCTLEAHAMPPDGFRLVSPTAETWMSVSICATAWLCDSGQPAINGYLADAAPS